MPTIVREVYWQTRVGSRKQKRRIVKLWESERD
jgi:hypothetical protein